MPLFKPGKYSGSKSGRRSRAFNAIIDAFNDEICLMGSNKEGVFEMVQGN